MEYINYKPKRVVVGSKLKESISSNNNSNNINLIVNNSKSTSIENNNLELA